MGIVLIGFMGSGKSTVAKMLGRRLQLEVVETDQEIEAMEKMPISKIFETKGEEYFRNQETKLLTSLQEQGSAIISCGGGTPLRECNVVEMKKNGPVVWLTAKPETIWERLKGNADRPLLQGNMNVDYIKSMMEAREERYNQAADYIVCTDEKSLNEICEEIIDKVREEL